MPKHPHVPDFVFTGPFLNIGDYPLDESHYLDWAYVAASVHQTIADPHTAPYLPFQVFQRPRMDAAINSIIQWTQYQTEFQPTSGQGPEAYAASQPVKDACEAYRTQWVSYMKALGR